MREEESLQWKWFLKQVCFSWKWNSNRVMDGKGGVFNSTVLWHCWLYYGNALARKNLFYRLHRFAFRRSSLYEEVNSGTIISCRRWTHGKHCLTHTVLIGRSNPSWWEGPNLLFWVSGEARKNESGVGFLEKAASCNLPQWGRGELKGFLAL